MAVTAESSRAEKIRRELAEDCAEEGGRRTRKVLKNSLGIKLKKGESAGGSKMASERLPRRFRERIIV